MQERKLFFSWSKDDKIYKGDIMTFTTVVKDEVTHNDNNSIELLCELSAYIRFNSQIQINSIIITVENATVAKRIYKSIKEIFGINIKITVRNQRKLRIKQIYILEIHDKISQILKTLNIDFTNIKKLPEEYFLESEEEKIAYLRGMFLACGSISDPKISGYHLEFTTKYKKEAAYVIKLLNEFKLTTKVLKRTNNYMAYVKSAEMISDFLKLLGATNAMFYFEDIRIYRDHKNTVNRLNNCELANQERTIKTGLRQLEEINYLKEHDLIELLDDKIKKVIYYREKYPETSFQELAKIINIESGKNIGKSAVNHYFIKIKDIVEKHKKRK